MSIIDNVYQFPAIISSDKALRMRTWQMFVRLIKTKKDFTTVNWPLMEEPELPFKPEYLLPDGPALPKSYAQYWVERGIIDGKITREAPTYATATNVGRANERNHLQQAVFEATKKYNDRRQRVGIIDSPHADHPLLYPMRATAIEKVKYKYPMIGQPKLDGERRLAYMSGKEIVMYTRDLKINAVSPAVERIHDDLRPILKRLKGIYLDGELYVHGISQQELHSLSSAGDADGHLEFHIYDCFYRDRPADTFEQRWAYLSEFKDSEYVRFVEQHPVRDQLEEDSLYDDYLARGYEGLILRVPEGTYTFGTVKEQCRSKQLLKRKPEPDEEFEVVDFTAGKNGKDLGALIWICQTDQGLLFRATPKGCTKEERKELYRDCLKHFDDKYKGRMLKVQYKGKSVKGVPKTAYSLGFRDFM